MQFEIFGIRAFILYIVFFLAGIIDAVSGGGGLIGLPTFLMVGFPVHYILGTSQMAAAFGGMASFAEFARNKLIYWPVAVIATPFSIAGAILGARLNLAMPEEYLRVIMIILVPVVAAVVLLKKDFGNEDRTDELSRPQLWIRSALTGLLCGCYQGFYGGGSGTFYLLGFSLFTRMDLIHASGTMKFTVFIATLTGAVTYALSGATYWPMVLPLLIFNVAGNYAGARLAVTKGTKIIRPMFIGILVILIITVAKELFTAGLG